MPSDDVPPSVREVASRLAEPKPMRRGSLSVRYVKCNKPGSSCAEDPFRPDTVRTRLADERLADEPARVFSRPPRPICSGTRSRPVTSFTSRV